MEEAWYTYIIECTDKTLYIGTTNNIEERILKHNTGKGAKYTKGRSPVKLLYTHCYESRSEACKYESDLKRHSKIEKLAIIKSPENEMREKKKRKT